MIDLQRAKEAFNHYVKHYDPKDEKIALKIKHTYQVMEVSMLIAKEQGLSQEQVSLAGLIGLLHDIGRFEQVRRYDTFFDADSVNHASFGVELLQQHGFLRSFIEEETYDAIIYTAIRNHNRFQIEDGLEKDCYVQSCIIRDADKVDILRINQEFSTDALFMCTQEEMCNSLISKEVLSDFLAHHSILADKRKTHADTLISHAALMYDINFTTALHIIASNGWIPTLLQRFSFTHEETRRDIQRCLQEVEEYMRKQAK